MFPLTTLRITVCGILMAADWTKVGGAKEEVPVRLVSEFQGSHCAGKLQMLGQGSWASVCTGSTPSDITPVARVICKQLGCGDVTLGTSMRPSHREPSFIVECSGEEANVQECAIKANQSYCYRELVIVCSAFFPPPVLSVHGYGQVSSVYVYEKHPLEISCMLVPQWLTSARVELMDVTNGRTYTGSNLSPGESEKWNMDPPVRAGKYACYATMYVFKNYIQSSMSNSVIVTTGSWSPPSAGLIVGAVFTALIGAGILIYMCVWRVHKGGSQGNSAPQETQTVIPTTTPGDNTEDPETSPGDNTEDPETSPGDNTEDPETSPGDNTEDPKTSPGSDTENPISTPEANTESPGFSPGEEHTS